MRWARIVAVSLVAAIILRNGTQAADERVDPGGPQTTYATTHVGGTTPLLAHG